MTRFSPPLIIKMMLVMMRVIVLMMMVMKLMMMMINKMIPPQYAKMARYITHFSNHGAMATISSREPTTR